MSTIDTQAALDAIPLRRPRPPREGRGASGVKPPVVRAARRAGLLALGLLAGVLSPAPARAAARGPYSMEILVDGRPVAEYAGRGTTYVEARRGREYSIRLRNHTGERIAIALSVDGLNTIDAKTTPVRLASKWILEPWGSLTLDGWQTSASTARRFFFTSEARSYGAWLGRTRSFGLVSAAVYREARPRSAPIIMREESRRDAPEARGEELGGASGEGEGDDDRGPFDEMRRSAPGESGSKGRGRIEPDADAGAGAGAAAGAASPEGRSKLAPGMLEAQPRLSDDYAATGIGRELDHEVRRVHFVTEPHPAAVIEVRYEYGDALARLGVLPEPCDLHGDPLERRERSRGFDGMDFAPDPYGRDCR
jgi:hypothetical protein